MDNKVYGLISLLCKSTYITLKEIEHQTSSTRRQVLYRLDKINQELVNSDYAKIDVVQSAVTISQEVRNKLNGLIMDDMGTDYFLSSKERQMTLYLLMFIELPYLSINHFMAHLKVSKSTVLNELKELESECNKTNIKVGYDRNRGYYLIGEELDLRRFMMLKVIEIFTTENNGRFFDLFIDENHLDIFKYSKLVIDELSEKYSIEFVEDRLGEFIYIFIFIKARIVNCRSTDIFKETFEQANFEIMKTTKEYQFMCDLILNYKQSDCIATSEILYLTAWILGLSVGNPEEDTTDCLTIANIVERLMYRFEILSGLQYKNSEDIFRKLYCHLRPMYYRLLYHLPIVNPLKEKVKQEHIELYTLVLETVKPLESLFGRSIPEDEVAFLTMHFGAIYAGRSMIKIGKQKVGLIICSNGLGSSAILCSELITLLPEIHFLKPVESIKLIPEKEYDIVFSTTFLDEEMIQGKPIVYVRPVMNMQERYQVVREVCMKLKTTFSNIPNIEQVLAIMKKHGTVTDESRLANELIAYFSSGDQQIKEAGPLRLSQMADINLMNINVDAQNWEEAILKSGASFVKQGYATQKYLDEVISTTKINGAYYVIAPHIALPHVKTEFGALKIGLGINVLKKPIRFGHELDPVKYIFFLTAMDSETHLNALSSLVELFNDKQFYEILDNAKSCQEIVDYLKKCEQKNGQCLGNKL